MKPYVTSISRAQPQSDLSYLDDPGLEFDHHRHLPVLGSIPLDIRLHHVGKLPAAIVQWRERVHPRPLQLDDQPVDVDVRHERERGVVTVVMALLSFADLTPRA